MVKAKGEVICVYVLPFLYCDGNIDSFRDDLVAIGLSGLHPIQRTAGMSIEKVHERAGTKLCLIGNIDSSDTLVFGNENEIVLQTLQYGTYPIDVRAVSERIEHIRSELERKNRGQGRLGNP